MPEANTPSVAGRHLLPGRAEQEPVAAGADGDVFVGCVDGSVVAGRLLMGSWASACG